MMRLTIILCVFSFATACLAEGLQEYHNTDMHFSFILPEGWEAIPEEELPNKDRRTLRNDFQSKTVALCQKIGAEYFRTPYMLIQVKSTEDVKEKELEKLFRDNKQMTLKVLERNIEALQKGEGPSILKSWKGSKRIAAEADYDTKKHTGFEKIELRHKNLGSLVEVTVKVLGSYRMVTLKCYATGRDAEGFLDLVDEVVDSFAYDRGYGFGEGGSVAPGLTKKVVGRGIWFWIGPILFISVLFWLLRRWAQG